MADVRGMRELGQSFNQAADTFGNLSFYAPEGLKQSRIAADTARAQNDLTLQQQAALDFKNNQAWEAQAAGRDDYGTEEYATDKLKFLQDSGASPAQIVAARAEAQVAQHKGQLADFAQNYVWQRVTDRVANEIGQKYYAANLQNVQENMVQQGKTPQEAADIAREQATELGKRFMNEKGIAVHIDHGTGQIMAQDKVGNSVPIDPDIAAEAYKILGMPAPWNTLKDTQATTLATGKALGIGAPPSAPTVAPGAVSALEAASALRAIPAAEQHFRAVELKVMSDASAARKDAIKAANEAGTDAAAAGSAAYKAALQDGQPLVDAAKSRLEDLHRRAARTGAVVANAAAPPLPPAPAPAASARNPEQIVAAVAGPPPSGATPAAEQIATQPQAQNPQQMALQARQLIEQLHLSRDDLNSPEFQQYLATLDPRVRAQLQELLDHIANVQSVGPLPSFNNPRATMVQAQ